MVGFDVFLGDLFFEPDSLKAPAISPKLGTLSYAEAVGCSHIEIKKSRYPPMIGFDVFLGDLFLDPDSSTLEASKSIPALPPKLATLSYAEAVGYSNIEIKRSRYPPMIGFDVFLGNN